MSFYGKNYVFTNKQERLDEFLKAVGMPEDKIAEFQKFGPSQKLVKNGDTYTFITASPKGPEEKTFKSGVEFDDVGFEKIPVKTTYTVDGNTITQKVLQITTPEKGIVTLKREYNGDELILTFTTDKWDGVAKRFYKAE